MTPPLQLGLGIGLGLHRVAGPLGDPDAAAYRDLVALVDGTVLSSARLNELSSFFLGLDVLGLRSSFHDGACWRADTQPVSGSLAVSLKGLSNATLYNSPTRSKGGIAFNGATQFALGPVRSLTGARTWMPLYAQDRYWGSAAATITRLQGAASAIPRIYLYTTAGTGGSNVSFYNGVTGREIGSGYNRANPYLAVSAIRDRNLGLGVAGSISAKTRRNSTGAFSPEYSAAGIAEYTTGGACFAAETVDGVTVLYHNKCTLPGWMLFSKSLTDAEVDGFLTLLDDTLFPKFYYVIEGDSIQDDVAVGLANEGGFRGLNMVLREVATGGEISSQGVSSLGTGTGLNTTNLNGGGYPVIADVAFGANDLASYAAGSISNSTIHSNLRSIWAYAKAQGATVVANTIMASAGITTNSRDADRQAVNALIAADEGDYYDVLVDRDAWSLAASSTSPVYNDTAIFRDGVHLNLGSDQGNALLCRHIAATLDAAGVLP